MLHNECALCKYLQYKLDPPRLPNRAACRDEGRVRVVYNGVQEDGEYGSCHNIENGMLFQEHGGQDDQHHQNSGAIADCLMFLKIFTVPDRCIDADGIVNMDAREQICRGICGVEPFYQLDADIIMVKVSWTEIMSVRV